MASDQAEDFERRLLALIHHKLEAMDEDYPHGYVIGDFVLTFRVFEAPDPEDPPRPWYSPPFPGWWTNQIVWGSALEYWVEAAMLREALAYAEAEAAKVDVTVPEKGYEEADEGE
jgi:hypothetical protein